MGSCFSHQENQSINLEFSPTEMDLCDSRVKVETIQTIRSAKTGWFNLPYDMRRSVIDSMDLQTRAKLSQCSEDCYEEVMLSRNYIETIQIIDLGKEDRLIWICVKSKDEKWYFGMRKLSSGNCEVIWKMNEEIILTKTFENQDLMEIAFKYFNDFLERNTRSLTTVDVIMNDFPYDQTNINNLKSRKLNELTLSKNKDGIDPISSGFIDLDTLYRFHDYIIIPNAQLNVLFKLKSEFRDLSNPKFSLADIDDFLRRCLVDEELDENLKAIKICETNSNDVRQTIGKYMSVRRMKFKKSGKLKYIRFVRTSKKWENREYLLVLKKHFFAFHILK